MPNLQGICVLGATGSIGASTLDVVARHPDRFRVTALTAHANIDLLAQLCARFRPRMAVVSDQAGRARLRDLLGERNLADKVVIEIGRAGLIAAATLAETDVVMAAIVGAAGLPPVLAAAVAGKRLLLANKEAIVCAGALLMQAVSKSGAALLPVDSEHSAIHQCLASSTQPRRDVRRLILTASGGPFRRRADMSGVTPAEAVAHPNWVMGRKISVDSATLMNKGLEVIEASWLFSFGPKQIDVVVHPQSVIHSMVEFGDGSVVAQLGTPDMRTPIAYALGFPERIDSGAPTLDFLRLRDLTFEAPDASRFPCLNLAYDALRAGPIACIALNAANEIAVDAFLDERLAFQEISSINRHVVEAINLPAPRAIDDVLAADAAARRLATQRLTTTVR